MKIKNLGNNKKFILGKLIALIFLLTLYLLFELSIKVLINFSFIQIFSTIFVITLIIINKLTINAKSNNIYNLSDLVQL